MRRRALGLVAVGLVAGSLTAISASPPAQAVDAPLVRVGDVAVTEGDLGVVVVNMPVDLSAPSSVPVTMNYAIAGGSATPYQDYAPRTGKLRFAPKVVHMNISVYVFGNTIPQPNRTVAITLSNVVGATVDQGTGTLTIVDDDHDNATGVQANIGEVVVTRPNAGTHKVQIPITLSAPSPNVVSVNYSLECGVNDGLKLQATSGKVTFQSGQQTKYITATLPDNVNLDGTVALMDKLSVASGGVSIGDGQGEMTALDPADSEPVGTIVQQSVNSSGTPAGSGQPCDGNAGSLLPSISADGRYVAFYSDASNLVPGDTNGLGDVFVRDNVTGVTERDSVATDGSQFLYGTSGSRQNIESLAISPSGRYVAFFSDRNFGGPSNGPGGLFLHDRSTGQTTLVDAGAGGGNWPVFSANDRYLAFESANQLTPDDVDVAGTPPNYSTPYGSEDVFRYDIQAGTFQLVTKSYDGAGAWGFSPTISGDGRYVGFISNSPDIVPDDNNGFCNDAFVRDMSTGVTQQVDLDNSGQEPTTCDVFSSIQLSGNGQYAAFSTSAPNFDPFPQNQYSNEHLVWERDLVNQTTELIGPQDPIGVPGTPDFYSGESYVTGISSDGRFVSYEADQTATTLIQTYVYDRDTGDLTVVGTLPDGSMPNGDVYTRWSWYAPNAISQDGHYVVFFSDATNLVPTDHNELLDVFRQRIS